MVSRTETSETFWNSSDYSSVSNQPDNISPYIKASGSLRHMDMTFCNLTFADLYEKCNSFIWQPGWKFPLDIMDNESFLYCSVHIIYDILKCRWIQKSSDFSFDGKTVMIRTILGRERHLSYYLNSVWGLEEKGRCPAGLGCVEMVFELKHIPDILSFGFDFPVSSNVSVVIGSDLKMYDGYEVLNNVRYSHEEEYVISGRRCSTKCVFRFPDETLVYSAEII